VADFIDEATSNELAERFVRRVAERGVVYLLRISSGCAQSESNRQVDDKGEPTPVLLFFSDAAYARAVKNAQYPEYVVAQMALFDLCGPERDAFELRAAINDALPPEVRVAHKKESEKATH
jgi:hypothetical protein